jgi:hypothetical protein
LDASVSLSGAQNEDKNRAKGPARYDLVRINTGLRVGYVPTSGFDMFASNDVHAQFSVDGTYPVLTRGKFVLGVGIGWDAGERTERTRGIEASLTTHRMYVPVEGRFHFAPSFYVFGKIAPGAAAALASVKDASSPNELSATGWALSGDASVGASILLGPRANMHRRKVRFWLTPELGYSVTTAAPLRVSPGRDDEDLLGSDESANLRGLALRGFFWRASVGVTF